MRSLLTILAVLVLSVPALSNPDYLPFPVSVGDKPAMETESSDNFAVVETAVAPSAAMAVKDVEGQIIVNIFPCDETGNVKNGVQPFILLFDAPTSKSVSDNMQAKQLQSGWHLANVVGGGKTSRVLFQVE